MALFGCSAIHDGFSPVVKLPLTEREELSEMNRYEIMKDVYPPAKMVKLTMARQRKKKPKKSSANQHTRIWKRNARKLFPAPVT